MLRIDKVQLEILINGDPARLKLTELNKEASALRKEIKTTKDEFEKGVKMDKLKDLEKQMEDVRQEIGLAGMSMKELGQRANQLKTILANLKPGTKEFKEYKEELDKVNARQKELRGQTESHSKTLGSLKAAYVATVAAITGFIAATAGLIGNVISVRREFEKYEAVLTTALGSHEKANDAMNMLADFAAKTNFQLTELTENYVKFANRGLVLTQEQMTKMADVANATGKSFGQLSEAILDINNPERWKELGIKVEATGNKVKLSFKGMTQEVDRTEKGVIKAMEAFGTMPGVMGQTAAISKTLDGQLSNLSDSMDRMYNALGEGRLGGAIKGVVGFFGRFVDKVTQWMTIPTSEKLQNEKTDINLLVNSIMSLNEGNSTRNQMIKELQEKYPDFLKNLDTEKLTNEQLKKRLEEVNGEYLKKIRIAVVEEDIAKVSKEQYKVQKDQYNLVKTINALYAELLPNKSQDLSLEQKILEISKQKRSEDIGNGKTVMHDYYAIAMELQNNYMKNQKEEARLQQEYNKLLDEQSKIKPQEQTTAQTTAALTEAQKQRILLYQKYIDEKRAMDTALTADEEKKLQAHFSKQIEEQKKYIKEVLQMGMNAVERENNEYTERLKKAGLFNADRKRLTGDQVKALEILEKQHNENLEKIKKDTEDKKKANQETWNKEILEIDKESNQAILNQLTERYISELEAAEANVEAKKAIEEKYRQNYLTAELGQLISTKQLMEALGMETVSIEKAIQDKKIEILSLGFDRQKETAKNQNEILREFNILSLAQQEQEELLKLEEAYQNKEITVDQHESALLQIKLKYAQEYVQQYLQIITSLGNAVSGLQNTELTNSQTRYQQDLKSLEEQRNKKLISEETFNKKKTALDKKQQEEEKKIKKKYADIDFAVKVAQIIASTAVSIMQAYAQLGPIAGTVAAVLLGVVGGVQVAEANAQRNQVKQLARGKYSVTGAEDGQTYRDVPYIGVAETGLYTRPTLIAEKGPEIVLSAPHTKNLQMNYPGILNAIMATRVPQYADGSYTSASGSAPASANNDRLVQLIATNIQVLGALNSKLVDLRAKVVMDEFKQAEAKYDALKADVSKS